MSYNRRAAARCGREAENAMVQDIGGERTELFPQAEPRPGDWIFTANRKESAAVPWEPGMQVTQPLVRVGERTFFLGMAPGAELGSDQRLRRLAEPEVRFGAFCSLHLTRWLLKHRFCGVCGTPLTPSEHSLFCQGCGERVFPTIAPAVILGIIHGGRLLVTHYAPTPGREYRGPALVAGYCEVGETVEETCRREAFEETGLRIGGLRYYASQPWGLSGSLLMGFFGEAESDGVTLKDGELGDAAWLRPDEVPPPPDAAGPLSLTATMINAFAGGFNPFEAR